MKRAAVIGLGDISSIHMMCIQNNPDITLAAVCDIDERRREQAPAGVPFYTNYFDMISNEKPDVVHVCLPHNLHVPVSIAAAERGVHVLCEKPVALNAKEGKAFADFEESHPDIHIGICLQNRFNESVKVLKAIIDGGKYGKVCGTKGIVPWARSRAYYDSKPWRGKWNTAGGGCMINQSVHTLDLLYFLGGPVAGVKASVSQLLNYGIEVEDTVTANLFYENGAHGLFVATNANYKNESVQISIQLEYAEFAIIENVLYQMGPDGDRKQLAEDAKLAGTKFYYGASHGALIDKFYESIERDNQEYLHVKDAIMSICLIDSIQESGRAGTYVEISLPD